MLFSCSSPWLVSIVTVLLSLIALNCDSGEADRITISPVESSEVGILMIGGHLAGDLKMETKIVKNESELTVTYFTSSTGSVFGFTKGHPPSAAYPVGWTIESDTVRVKFSPLICIPLDIWIVGGEFSSQLQRARDAVRWTALVWAQENQGFCLEIKDLHDETGNAKAGNYSTSETSTDNAFSCDRVDKIKEDIGSTAEHINVYVVDAVATDFGIKTSYGLWCSNGNVIALGSSVSDHVLVHELGHAFSLDHIDLLSKRGQQVEGSPILFDSTNVMAGGSTLRHSLTEGQTLRSVLNAGSFVNESMKARPGKVLTDDFCGTDAELKGALCPPIHKRLWIDQGEDGTKWDPN